MFMIALVDDLMTSYTNTCPEAGLFVRLPRSSRLRLRCRGRTAFVHYWPSSGTAPLFGRNADYTPMRIVACGSPRVCNIPAAGENGARIRLPGARRPQPTELGGKKRRKSNTQIFGADGPGAPATSRSQRLSAIRIVDRHPVHRGLDGQRLYSHYNPDDCD